MGSGPHPPESRDPPRVAETSRSEEGAASTPYALSPCPLPEPPLPQRVASPVAAQSRAAPAHLGQASLPLVSSWHHFSRSGALRHGSFAEPTNSRTRVSQRKSV